MYIPLEFLLTSPDANISSSPKPSFFNALYNSSNSPENPILNAFNVLLSSFFFFMYSCPVFAVGLYKFLW